MYSCTGQYRSLRKFIILHSSNSVSSDPIEDTREEQAMRTLLFKRETSE
jgi:hypothetical protein